MRVRIVRPLPDQIEGLLGGGFAFGASYDIPAPLSDLLLMMGYAVSLDLESSSQPSPPVGRRTPAAAARAGRDRDQNIEVPANGSAVTMLIDDPMRPMRWNGLDVRGASR